MNRFSVIRNVLLSVNLTNQQSSWAWTGCQTIHYRGQQDINVLDEIYETQPLIFDTGLKSHRIEAMQCHFAIKSARRQIAPADWTFILK